MSDDGQATASETTGRISDWVADRILDRIGKGDLEPGQRLPGERQLAEQLNVSRVSVRAALQKLKTQGFLTAVQGGGTRVVSSAGGMDGALTEMVRVKLDNLYDLVEIRIQLETWAARRAAERGSAEQIAALGQIVASMAMPGGNRSADDMDFHLAIGRAAASPVYLHLLFTIRDTLGQMVEFHHSPAFAVDEEKMYQHHCAIHEAIAQRKPDAAAEAVREHLSWVLRRYQEMGTTGGTPLSGRSAPGS